MKLRCSILNRAQGENALVIEHVPGKVASTFYRLTPHSPPAMQPESARPRRDMNSTYLSCASRNVSAAHAHGSSISNRTLRARARTTPRTRLDRCISERQGLIHGERAPLVYTDATSSPARLRDPSTGRAFRTHWTRTRECGRGDVAIVLDTVY